MAQCFILTDPKKRHLQLLKQPFTDVLQNNCLKNFVIFTGKYLCWNVFFIKEIPTQVFSSEYCEIFKSNFSQKTSGRLLLKLGKVSNRLCHWKLPLSRRRSLSYRNQSIDPYVIGTSVTKELRYSTKNNYTISKTQFSQPRGVLKNLPNIWKPLNIFEKKLNRRYLTLLWKEDIKLLHYHKMPKIWTSPPLFALFGFVCPLPPHEHSKFNFNPSPLKRHHPVTRTVNF